MPTAKQRKTTHDKAIVRVLEGQRLARPPVWLMRQAGRYLPEYRAARERAGGFLELCLTPALAADVTLQPVRRFALDAAILFSDILVIPYALGQAVRFSEGEGPLLDAFHDVASLTRLSNTHLQERLAPIYEAVERVAAALPAETVLIGFAGAPWTVASYMVEGGTSRDFAAVKAWAFGRPEEFSQLIGLLVQATTDYLVQQVKAGAEVLQLFDSWAGALPEAGFDRWCVEPVREIVRRVRSACPDVPIIGFPRGAGMGYMRFVERTGVHGVSLDPAVPLAWAARELQPRCALQGNLDPALLLVGGGPMRQQADRILAAWGQGPFIFNLGHGVLPTTPPEHVAELVEFIRAWGG